MERSIKDILKDHAAWDVWREMAADSPEKYQAYLCSRDWALLRNQVLERCGGMCERCKVNKADSVHHLHYATRYRESPDDLRAFCRGCHEYTHGKSDVDPITEAFNKFPTRPLSDVLTVTDQWYGERKNAVHCPCCDDDHSHIRSVGLNPNGANQGKVIIGMWGEYGHAWDIVIFGHKGNAFAEVGNVRNNNNA